MLLIILSTINRLITIPCIDIDHIIIGFGSIRTQNRLLTQHTWWHFDPTKLILKQEMLL